MQSYLKKAYCSCEGVYEIPIYGMFKSDRLPDCQLKLPNFAVSKSSDPFHLEYPDYVPRYETYVFDVELEQFPMYWRHLTDTIFDELQRYGAQFSWLSLDPGFDFELMFGDYFAQHVYAFCQLCESPVYVESEDKMFSHSWAKRIKNLEAKWRLVGKS